MPSRKVIACVIVRMKSTRLPKKALADVQGKPLLLRLVENIRQAKRIDDVVICTSTHPDDTVLLDLARQWGVPAIAGSEDDVVERMLQAARTHQADVVIRVTGDNLFTDPDVTDMLIEQMEAANGDYARMNGLPLGVTSEVMTVEAMHRLQAVIPDPVYSEYMTLYAFQPDQFKCVVPEAPPNIYRPNYSLTVDTPADLALLQDIFKTLSDGACIPALNEVTAYLDEKPDYQPVAGDAPIRMPDNITITFDELQAMWDERGKQARALLNASV